MVDRGCAQKTSLPVVGSLALFMCFALLSSVAGGQPIDADRKQQVVIESSSGSPDPYIATIQILDKLSEDEKSRLLGGQVDLSDKETAHLQYEFCRDLPLVQRVTDSPMYALGDRTTHPSAEREDSLVRNLAAMLKGAAEHACEKGDVDEATSFILASMAACRRCPLPREPYRWYSLQLAWVLALDVIEAHPQIARQNTESRRAIWVALLVTDFTAGLVETVQMRLLDNVNAEPIGLAQGVIAPELLDFYGWWLFVITERTTGTQEDVEGQLPNPLAELPEEAAATYKSLRGVYKNACAIDAYTRLASMAMLLEENWKEHGQYPPDRQIFRLHGIRFTDPNTKKPILYNVSDAGFTLNIDIQWVDGNPVTWKGGD